MRKQCQAVAKQTKKQCQKNALRGSAYCWGHQSKAPLLIGVIVSAALGWLITLSYDSLVESEELRELRVQSKTLDLITEAVEKISPKTNTLEAVNALIQRVEQLESEGPRTLSEEQSARWTDDLRQYAGVRGDLWVIAPPGEAHKFARQLSKVLENAGWLVEMNRFWSGQSKGFYRSGIEIEARYTKADPLNIRLAAKAVYKLLSADGFTCRLSEQTNPGDEVHIEVLPKP